MPADGALLLNPAMPPFVPERRRSLLLFVLSFTVAAVWPVHAAKPGKEEARVLKREFAADDPSAKPKNRDLPAEVRERKAGANAPQERVLARVREQMEITDEGEWALIVERIGKVDGMRRELLGGGAASPRPVAAAGDRVKRSAGTSEREALRTAVTDKLPDAEIKARLLRARELQQQKEARLATAQAELRAVLTVRQEAIAVIAGWLPP